MHASKSEPAWSIQMHIAILSGKVAYVCKVIFTNGFETPVFGVIVGKPLWVRISLRFGKVLCFGVSEIKGKNIQDYIEMQ